MVIWNIFKMAPLTPSSIKANVWANRAMIKTMHDSGKSDRQIAKVIGYHVKSVQKIIRAIKADSSKIECKISGRRPNSKVTATNIRKVKEMARKQPVRNMQQFADA